MMRRQDQLITRSTRRRVLHQGDSEFLKGTDLLQVSIDTCATDHRRELECKERLADSDGCFRAAREEVLSLSSTLNPKEKRFMELV